MTEWDNAGNLKAKLEPGKNVTTSPFFTRGSHKDDVLRLQGTPSEINHYRALGYEVCRYGYSSVTISINSERVVEWNNRGNLKITKLSGEVAYRPIKYHHKLADVTLYYDEDKAFSNVFSLNDGEFGKVYGVVHDGITYFYDDGFKPLDLYAYVDKNEELHVSSFKNSYAISRLNRFLNRLQHMAFSGDFSGAGTAMRIGDITFLDLISHNGTHLYGTSIDFDSISFDDFYSSTGATISGSRINIGDLSFGNWWSSDGNTFRGDSIQIGDITFHNYTSSDGSIYTGTTIDIGGFGFSDIYGWRRQWCILLPLVPARNQSRWGLDRATI